MRLLKWMWRQVVIVVPPVAVALTTYQAVHWAGASKAAAVLSALIVYGAAAYAWVSLYGAMHERRAAAQ
ncbi:hypothetical protein ACFVYG_24000 [Streptomyces sp. NPDC058256]|uniref:hypothetical protein n=1 Tax=Streptomyces sp. NPDC058256 TaxID=3346408 RepID=UPI0036F05608